MRTAILLAAALSLTAGTALAQTRPARPCSADPRCATYNPPGGVDIRPSVDTRVTGTQPFRSGISGSGTRPANPIQRQGVPQRR